MPRRDVKPQGKKNSCALHQGSLPGQWRQSLLTCAPTYMRAPGDTDDGYGFGNGTPSYSYTPQQPQQAAPQLPQPTGGVGFQPQPGG